ncbi:hypothetical protein SCYAM73S_05236 [Streptomyces cyaneofuscatus]
MLIRALIFRLVALSGLVGPSWRAGEEEALGSPPAPRWTRRAVARRLPPVLRLGWAGAPVYIVSWRSLA